MTMKQEASKDAAADRRLPAGMLENSESPDKRSQVRAKRQSSIAIDSSLPNIDESEEASKKDSNEEGSVFGTSRQPSQNVPTDSPSFFQTEVAMDTESDSSARSSKSKQMERTRSNRQARASETSSSRHGTGRVKADSREAHADDFDFGRSLDTGSTNTNTPQSHHRHRSSSSKSSISSFTKLDLGNPPSQEARAETSSKSDSNSLRSPLIPDNFKMPHGKCINCAMNSGTDVNEEKNKTVTWKANKANKNRCMLCDVTDEAGRATQEDPNKLMMEIVYPHEFYDRYSRARNSKKANAAQGNTKEAISICKPARVSRKQVPAERSWNRLPRETVQLSDESGAMQYNGTIPEKRRKQHDADGVDGEPGRKEIHVQCKPRMNALVVTDSSRDQSLVLKGLKGWLLRKHDECNNKLHKDIKQSLYRVSTLGMQFGLPEYNKSLHDRKPTSPRPVTCMSARDQDNAIVIRPNTLGPRQRTMPAMPRDIPALPRDMYAGQSRGLDSLQRDLTNINIPHRLPTSQESKTKTIQSLPSKSSMTRVQSSQKSLEHAIAKVMKAGLSLPPIGSDVKASVKLGGIGPT